MTTPNQPLTDGKIFIGNSSGVTRPVAVTGDVTISNSGVTALAALIIDNADISATAAIAYSKLATLTSANILVGSAGNVATVTAVTGDVTIGNTGVTAIGAGKVLSAMLDEKTIKYATVTLTNANVKALNTTAFEAVAAPSASKVIQFLGASLQLDAGTNVLSETDDNIVFRYENTTGAIVSSTVETTGWIDQAADTITFATPKNDAIVATASAANKALMIHNSGNAEFADNAANDATVDVYVAYRILDVTT